jgi:import inner membrane translocase subunit TIM10
LLTPLPLGRSAQETCRKKCISTEYREAELTKGEGVCLDRCVSKFSEAVAKISTIMQEEQAKMANGGMTGMAGRR